MWLVWLGRKVTKNAMLYTFVLKYNIFVKTFSFANTTIVDNGGGSEINIAEINVYVVYVFPISKLVSRYSPNKSSTFGYVIVYWCTNL